MPLENKANTAIPQTVIDNINNHFSQIQVAIAPYLNPFAAEERQLTRNIKHLEYFVTEAFKQTEGDAEFAASLNSKNFSVDLDNVGLPL